MPIISDFRMAEHCKGSVPEHPTTEVALGVCLKRGGLKKKGGKKPAPRLEGEEKDKKRAGRRAAPIEGGRKARKRDGKWAAPRGWEK